MLYILIFMGGKEHWFIVCHTVSIWHVAGPWLSPQALDQNALETIEEVQLSRSIRRVLQPETLFETCWDVSWMSWMSWNVMKCHETCCLVHDRYRSHLHLKNIKFGSIWIFWFSVHIPFRSTGKTTETTENPGQRPRATSGHCSSAAFCVGCHWWWPQDAAGTSVGKDEARTGAAWLKKEVINSLESPNQ